MKIRMLETRLGSANAAGTRTRLYRRGETHDMAEGWRTALAEVFLEAGWAERVSDAAGAAPENKARRQAPERKRPMRRASGARNRRR